MKQKEEFLSSELSKQSSAFEISQADLSAALRELDVLRVQLQSAESERDRLQEELTASDARLTEVKESAKARLQKSVDKIRTMAAAADSKDLEVTRLTAERDDLHAQLEVLRREGQVRSTSELESTQNELRKALEKKAATDDICTDLRKALEIAISSQEAYKAEMQDLQEQLTARGNDITVVGASLKRLNNEFVIYDNISAEGARRVASFRVN